MADAVASTPDWWKCPQCGAGFYSHGSGPCLDGRAPDDPCIGLWCTEDTDPTPEGFERHARHGDPANPAEWPCRRAWCVHCNWRGEIARPECVSAREAAPGPTAAPAGHRTIPRADPRAPAIKSAWQAKIAALKRNRGGPT